MSRQSVIMSANSCLGRGILILEIKKAHDKFIRDLMSRKEVVQDFLRYYLDEKLVKLLDLSTLEIKKDTFVDQELVEHFSDILYQLKFRNGQNTQVYVLIEHKSYSDSLVAFQLLRYMINGSDSLV